MLIDIVSDDSYKRFNIKSAEIFGLKGAVYIERLLCIIRKAVRKGKINDGFIKVDRKYIVEETTLSKDEQYDLDSKLEQFNLIEKEDKDTLRLDISLYMSILNGELFELSDISDKFRSRKDKKNVKINVIIENLKNSITYTIIEMKSAMENYIESIVNSGKSLTTQSLLLFQQDLDNYSNGDISIALEIIKLATIYNYVICYWAISVYERQHNVKSDVRTTTQTRVDKLSDKIF